MTVNETPSTPNPANLEARCPRRRPGAGAPAVFECSRSARPATGTTRSRGGSSAAHRRSADARTPAPLKGPMWPCPAARCAQDARSLRRRSFGNTGGGLSWTWSVRCSHSRADEEIDRWTRSMRALTCVLDRPRCVSAGNGVAGQGSTAATIVVSCFCRGDDLLTRTDDGAPLWFTPHRLVESFAIRIIFQLRTNLNKAKRRIY